MRSGKEGDGYLVSQLAALNFRSFPHLGSKLAKVRKLEFDTGEALCHGSSLASIHMQKARED
jgi:hypothetical protein